MKECRIKRCKAVKHDVVKHLAIEGFSRLGVRTLSEACLKNRNSKYLKVFYKVIQAMIEASKTVIIAPPYPCRGGFSYVQHPGSSDLL